MSNDESLIYVLISLGFHIVHFRHFGGLKTRFLIILIIHSMILDILVLGLEISAKTTTFSM